tara:strand:+ start:1267 stop:1626 length:360 start_codon:yes stop_codon:yes gene_type:complete
MTPIPIAREEVPMPEWGDGVTVWVHGSTAREKNEHDAAMMNKDWSGVSKTKVKVQKERTVISSVRDESGGRIFSVEDIKVISEWPAYIVERIVKVADKLNGGETESESLAKNSGEAEQD